MVYTLKGVTVYNWHPFSALFETALYMGVINDKHPYGVLKGYQLKAAKTFFNGSTLAKPHENTLSKGFINDKTHLKRFRKCQL